MELGDGNSYRDRAIVTPVDPRLLVDSRASPHLIAHHAATILAAAYCHRGGPFVWLVALSPSLFGGFGGRYSGGFSIERYVLLSTLLSAFTGCIETTW